MSAGQVGVFCQDLGITTYTLNYSNFQNKFLFNNGSILKIIDYYNNRNRGNVNFTEFCEIINNLSNQDFAGLDKFRLGISLGKIKKMHVKMNKTKKRYRNESCMSGFLRSLFSPVMAKLAAGSSAGFLWKKDLLENKLLTASSEESSCLQGTVSLLNQCVGEEYQGRLQKDKELKILGKDFKNLNTRNINKKLIRKEVLDNCLKSENKLRN